jgi:ketosteroid isomerase-like protein
VTHSHADRRLIVRLAAFAALALVPWLPHTAISDSSRLNNGVADQELRNLEAQLGAALSQSNIDLLSHLWADEFVSTMADGHVVARERRLASLRAKIPDSSNKVTTSNDRVDIRTYGDWAVVLVTSSWHVDGKQVSDPYQATHVWAKQKGEWRLVAAHISEVKP